MSALRGSHSDPSSLPSLVEGGDGHPVQAVHVRAAQTHFRRDVPAIRPRCDAIVGVTLK